MWVDRVTAARAMIHMSRAIVHNEINRKIEQQSETKTRTQSIDADKKSSDEAMDVDGKCYNENMLIMNIGERSNVTWLSVSAVIICVVVCIKA